MPRPSSSSSSGSDAPAPPGRIRRVFGGGKRLPQPPADRKPCHRRSRRACEANGDRQCVLSAATKRCRDRTPCAEADAAACRAGAVAGCEWRFRARDARYEDCYPAVQHVRLQEQRRARRAEAAAAAEEGDSSSDGGGSTDEDGSPARVAHALRPVAAVLDPLPQYLRRVRPEDVAALQQVRGPMPDAVVHAYVAFLLLRLAPPPYLAVVDPDTMAGVPAAADGGDPRGEPAWRARVGEIFQWRGDGAHAVPRVVLIYVRDELRRWVLYVVVLRRPGQGPHLVLCADPGGHRWRGSLMEPAVDRLLQLALRSTTRGQPLYEMANVHSEQNPLPHVDGVLLLRNIEWIIRTAPHELPSRLVPTQWPPVPWRRIRNALAPWPLGDPRVRRQQLVEFADRLVQHAVGDGGDDDDTDLADVVFDVEPFLVSAPTP